MTCREIDHVNGWSLEPEQAAGTAREIADYVRRLRRVPVDARAVLSAVVDRGSAGGYLNHTMSCLLMDVALATGTPQDEVSALVAILEHWNVGRVDWESDERGLGQVIIYGLDNDWNMWDEIKQFAATTGRTVRDFAVELRFDLLDDHQDNP